MASWQESRDIVNVVLDGRWIIPSLIDLHVHATHSPTAHLGGNFAYDEPDDVATFRGIQNLSRSVASGVCAARDLGGNDNASRILRRIGQDAGLGLPTLQTSGRPYCVPSGHGAAFGQSVHSRDDIERSLKRQLGYGHQWVKIMSGPEQFSPYLLRILVERSHDAGLRVAMHAFSDHAVAQAIAVDVDTVEHCLVGPNQNHQLSGMQYVPTLYALRSSLSLLYTRSSSISEKVLLQEWKKYLTARLQAHIQSGLPVLAGTDGGCAPCNTSDIMHEIIELNRAGFDVVDLLAWSSASAAKVLGLDQEFGAIEPGYVANMIVLDEDPRFRVETLLTPLLVLHRGVPVVDRLEVRVAAASDSSAERTLGVDQQM